MVRTPYIIIAALFLLTAVVMYFSQLPEVAASNEHGESQTSSLELRKVFARNHLVMGVIAQFLYVGAQVGVTSFFIRFVEHAWPGTPEKKAAQYLLMHLVGFLVDRDLGQRRVVHHVGFRDAAAHVLDGDELAREAEPATEV